MAQASSQISQNWVIANWKMNPVSVAEVHNLMKALAQKCEVVATQALQNSPNLPSLPNIAIAPSFLHLGLVGHYTDRLPIGLSAQNVCGHNASHGAFTGEISAKQLADMQVESVIIGHSERRQYFAESDAILAKKIENAFENNLSVIFCIGESHEQYLAKQTFEIIEQQLEVLAQFASQVPLPDEKNSSMPKILVAYEPIWAIGTGLTPNVAEIADIHNFISEILSTMQLYAPIIYGGSVNAKNVADIASIDLVDGVLVGGASLNADSFWEIITAFGE